jgi:hypothetical protein
MAEEEQDPDKQCFVVGPIGSDDGADRIRADWLLEMVIQPVMEGFPQFEVKRADKISTPGMRRTDYQRLAHCGFSNS